MRDVGDRISQARRSIRHGDKGRRAEGGMGLFGLVVEVDGGVGF